MNHFLTTLAALACLSSAGCLSHLPASRELAHLNIEWVEDFQTARGIAAEEARPILLVMVAGGIRDLC